MATVQSTENNGAIIAHGSSVALLGNSYANATAIEISLSAEYSKLTIKDKTNSKTYYGTYSVTDSNSQSVIYKIMINEKDETTVLSNAEYVNGTSVATMILSIGKYALNFQRSK